VGVLFSAGFYRPVHGPVFLRHRCGISFFGVLVFWFESIFLGLGDQPHRGLVLLWLGKEFLGVNTLKFEYFMMDL
jgi:hypothetical protein